jgi:PAS domain S-box-containing protein
MTPEASERVDASVHAPPAVPMFSIHGSAQVDESGNIELPPELRADLLDLDAWGGILSTYSRTMRVAVGLTDSEGHLLGECHNAQPVWSLVHGAVRDWGTGCPFCITNRLPCNAVAEALQTGGAVMVRDQAGLTHVAVPLSLGRQHLGAIIAGQVFDKYPDPLSVRRVAKEFGVSAQELWDVARKQRPVSGDVLQASGDLLCALGQAFLRQRYGAILEGRLAETNGRFRLLVEGVQDHALFTIDLTGQVTSWNLGAERLLGYVEAEILGKNFSCIFSPDDTKNHVPEQLLHKASQAGRTEDEGWRVRWNGKLFWANVNITALLEDPGRVRGFAVIIKDVTERRKIATVLEESREERKRLQEKFLSHISHELRTPLTAIHFFTTNVLDGLFGELTPQQHEHLALAVDNVRQLTVMVSDLLDITRVDTHKLTVEPRYANVAKLISEALTTCSTNAAAKNINLHSEAVTGLASAWADPARVRQILINLIDNGVKFTAEGGSITVNCRPFADRDGFLSISVSDTGCGISPENCEIVFDRLSQLESGAEPSRSGLGLGLFIARDLVLQQGGRIWVESQLGHGSTFFFTLPVFSLAKLCAHVFIEPNLEAGCVTLIAVDVVAVAATDQENIQPEIQEVLTRCIHAGQDVLLPSMGDKEPVESFFIVACTDPRGFAVIATRIVRELRNLDCVSQLKPVISSTTLLVTPGRSRGEHIGEVTALIERLIQAHLSSKERLK